MATPNIQDYLKYANLQMAAEAFLVTDAGMPKTGIDYTKALTDGNFHASRFTPTGAAAFAAQWEVIDQRANTATGFSGTLFRNKANPQELVLSFRSTEFIDDAVRDNLATNTDEIKNTGWAWGQIADMEQWYKDLQANPDFAGKRYSVTGYSLGGHLATAFNLLRRDDGTQGNIDQVVTLNGAGVGKVKEGTLTAALTYFTDLRSDPERIVASFTRVDLQALYRTLKKTNYTTREQVAEAQRAVDALYSGALTLEAKRLRAALGEIDAMIVEAARIAPYTAGGNGEGAGSHPKDVSAGDILARSLDYRMAVSLAAQRTESATLLGGAERTVFNKEYLQPALTNQHDLVGDTAYSMVANSQWHYGTDVKVFIEDQPEFRGTVIANAASTSWDVKDFKLLVDHYAENDFGDTHSLVLLVDSLSLMQVFRKLDPTLKLDDLSRLFKSASASKVRSETGTQGKADGDTLEALVDALHKLFVGSDPELRKTDGLNDGGTWATEAWRDKFFKALDLITGTPLYQALVASGQGKVVTPASKSADGIASAAKAGDQDALAWRYALFEGNPFAITGVDYRGKNNDHQLDLYDPKTGVGDLTAEWIADRATWLGWRNYQNTQNETRAVSTTAVRDNWRLQDWNRGHQDNIDLNPMPPSTAPARLMVFGKDGDDAGGLPVVGGAGDDRLYGMGGNDLVRGEGGADHLEGNRGDDTLQGGEGRDTLVGGIGADRLEGGKDNDLIKGGLGADTYVFTSGDGWDTIEDAVGGTIVSGGRGSDFLTGSGGGTDVFADTSKTDGALVANTLQFGPDITPDDLTLALGSLKIQVGSDPDDAIHLGGFNPDDPLASISIDRFVFDDGTVLSAAASCRRDSTRKRRSHMNAPRHALFAADRSSLMYNNSVNNPLHKRTTITY